MTLEEAIDLIIPRPARDAQPLAPLADYARQELERYGLPGAMGGAGGELTMSGLARAKRWDVAYSYAGKNRLGISLKSMWQNIADTVPNRIDDLMGEAANVQQLFPEIVIGYILLFDATKDRRRKDGLLWSEYFEARLNSIAIRKAPLWNQGLLEGCWFIRFDPTRDAGSRVVDPGATDEAGRRFFLALLRELRLREPAIPFTREIPSADADALRATDREAADE